ncbi:nitroreductase/quinone reductase family protein [Actinoplanes sp. NPDC051411]|uniref:nitroreductase/quinone reductase family protein n=1 Tax=Actinoplanes sp. NPDC051411 TaxID=3155522 RepID=UPI00342E1975
MCTSSGPARESAVALVEVGVETFACTARVETGYERDARYELFATRHPQLSDYQARTQRRIPIVALSRRR